MGWLSFTLHLCSAMELQRRNIKVCQLSHKRMGTNESKFKTLSHAIISEVRLYFKIPETTALLFRLKHTLRTPTQLLRNKRRASNVNTESG